MGAAVSFVFKKQKSRNFTTFQLLIAYLAETVSGWLFIAISKNSRAEACLMLREGIKKVSAYIKVMFSLPITYSFLSDVSFTFSIPGIVPDDSLLW